MVIVYKEAVTRPYIIYSRFSIAFIFKCMRWVLVLAIPIIVVGTTPITLQPTVRLQQPVVDSQSMTIFQYGGVFEKLYSTEFEEVNGDSIADYLDILFPTLDPVADSQLLLSIVVEGKLCNITIHIPEAFGKSTYAQYYLRNIPGGVDTWTTDLVAYNKSDTKGYQLRIDIVPVLVVVAPSVQNQGILNSMLFLIVLTICHIVIGYLYGLLFIRRIVKAKILPADMK